METVQVAALSAFAVGTFLAIANKEIVDAVFAPIRKRFPDLDLWWVVYVALATGAAIAWFAEVNFFGEFVPNEILGRVLSAVVVGGGASLIHDIFDR